MTLERFQKRNSQATCRREKDKREAEHKPGGFDGRLSAGGIRSVGPQDEQRRARAALADDAARSWRHLSRALSLI